MNAERTPSSEVAARPGAGKGFWITGEHRIQAAAKPEPEQSPEALTPKCTGGVCRLDWKPRRPAA